MGAVVNPYDVAANGSRHLHAIWSGGNVIKWYYNVPVTYSDDLGNQMNITSLDCPLVAPGDVHHLLNFDGDSQPNCENGMHFNLFNNLWYFSL